MKVAVNKDACLACGQCTVACPEVFEINNDEGYAVAKAEEVAEELREKVEDAKTGCPTDAISVE